MDRNTVLAFLLMGIILIAWLWYTAPPPQPPSQKPKVENRTETDTTKHQITKAQEEKRSSPQLVATGEEVDSLGQYFKNLKPGRNEIITIENDLFRAEFTTTGAKVLKYFVKKYDEYYGDGSKGIVQLINSKAGGDFVLEFMSLDGKYINTGNYQFTPSLQPGTITLGDKDSVTISFTLEVFPESYVKKSFTIYKDKYGFRTDIEFQNIKQYISDNRYTLVWQNGIRFVEQNSADESAFALAEYFSADEVFQFDAAHFNEKVPVDDVGFKSRKVDWFGLRNKYFTMVVIPPEDQIGEIKIEGIKLPRPNSGAYELYSAYYKKSLSGGNNLKHSYFLYLGPIDYKTLKEIKPSLTTIVDFGSFFGLKFIVRPIAEYLLLPLLLFLHSFISNFGIVIIIFSIIIKILLQPLTAQSMKSMKKMQLLQPKISEIKEKYKDDPNKMNAETMKLYKVYGINPAGGCLPLLLQMPILIALYGLFRAVIDIRHQPFTLWISDLSAPDIILKLPFRIPLLGIDVITGLALLMGITTFIQQKQTLTDPRQKSMIYIMPILLTLLFASFPSGLNLYYFMFNLLSIGQQYYTNKYGKKIELVPVKESGKKGFFQKLLEQAEENAKERRKKMSKIR